VIIFEYRSMLAQLNGLKVQVPCSLREVDGGFPTATFVFTPLSYNFAANSRRYHARLSSTELRGQFNSKLLVKLLHVLEILLNRCIAVGMTMYLHGGG